MDLTCYYSYVTYGLHLEQMNGLVLNREHCQSPPVQVNTLIVRQVDLVAFELFRVAEHSIVESDNMKGVIFERLLAWQKGLVVLINVPVAEWKSSIWLSGGSVDQPHDQPRVRFFGKVDLRSNYDEPEVENGLWVKLLLF